jgi:hypothetical protein
MDLIMTLRMCRLMVSRMHLAETDGAAWLFPASSGAATLIGVIHPTQPSRTYPPGGHALAAVYARVIWSLASELNGLPTAVAVVFPCGAGRVSRGRRSDRRGLAVPRRARPHRGGRPDASVEVPCSVIRCVAAAGLDLRDAVPNDRFGRLEPGQGVPRHGPAIQVLRHDVTMPQQHVPERA